MGDPFRGLDVHVVGRLVLQERDDDAFLELVPCGTGRVDDTVSAFIDETKDPTADCSDAQVMFRRLDIGKDVDVLGDAVAIAVEDGIDTLATYDSDLTKDEHIETINDIIDRKVDGLDRLHIVDTAAVSHSELKRITAS